MSPRWTFTTPGYLSGPGAREAADSPEGSGPINVVSTLALMDYDLQTCRMRLAATNPGVMVEEVIANTGFELIIPDKVGVNELPSAQELRLSREEIDPGRFYT